jgi:hypothetical protein
LGKPQTCVAAADHQQLPTWLDKRLDHEYICINFEVVAMTVSIFPVSGSRVSGFPGPRSRSRGREVGVPAILAAALLLLALVVAPERPQVQEAICQRHNGVEACRVW